MDIDLLEQWIHVRFISLWDLTKKLPKLIEEDLEQRQRELEDLIDQHDPSAREDVWSRGYTTFGQLQELEKSEPEAVEKYHEQSRLWINIVMLESDLDIAESTFERNALSAMVIMFVAHFEDSLRRTCELLHQKDNAPLKWTDLRGSTLDAFKGYLSKVIQVELDFGKSLRWEAMKEHQAVRNLLVHNGGIKDGSSQANKAIKVVRKNPSLEFNEYGELDLNIEYADSVVEAADGFVVELYKAIRDSGI